jgi:hypothetical protein
MHGQRRLDIIPIPRHHLPIRPQNTAVFYIFGVRLGGIRKVNNGEQRAGITA